MYIYTKLFFIFFFLFSFFLVWNEMMDGKFLIYIPFLLKKTLTFSSLCSSTVVSIFLEFFTTYEWLLVILHTVINGWEYDCGDDCYRVCLEDRNGHRFQTRNMLCTVPDMRFNSLIIIYNCVIGLSKVSFAILNYKRVIYI